MTTGPRANLLVTPEELDRELQQSPAPLVLDVRWQLGDLPGAGRARYLTGHLPGAVHVDVEDVFSGEAERRTDGRHPLPDPARLAAGLARAGVTAGRRLVVVDDPGTFAAERAWWVLRWAGQDVRVLDGGIPAWQAAGLAVTTGGVQVTEATPMALTTGAMPVVSADEAGAAGQDPARTLIDARSPQRYRGEAEPIDPVAGHIPGAVNIPVSGMFAPDGTLPDDATLRALLDPQRHPVPVVYCGSGVSAAREVLAFAALGVPVQLFSGSWSAWCNDPFRPVARGDGS